LKRTYKFGFFKEMLHISVLFERSAGKLFKYVQNPNHCLNQLLLPSRPAVDDSRPRGHKYSLPHVAGVLLFYYIVRRIS